MTTQQSVKVAQIVSVAIVAGAIVWTKYQDLKMARDLERRSKKIEGDMNRIREAMKNLGKN